MDFFLFYLIPLFFLPQFSSLALIMWWIFTAKRERSGMRAWGLTVIALAAWAGMAMSVVANICFSFFDGWDDTTGIIFLDLCWQGMFLLVVMTHRHLRPAGFIGLLAIIAGWINTGYILEHWIYPMLGKNEVVPMAMSERDDFDFLYFGFWALLLCTAVYFFSEKRKDREDAGA